jgi:hypothetical protein
MLIFQHNQSQYTERSTSGPGEHNFDRSIGLCISTILWVGRLVSYQESVTTSPMKEGDRGTSSRDFLDHFGGGRQHG